jgi:[ribosomal protein S5]-alanine N-acetyltransferase
LAARRLAGRGQEWNAAEHTPTTNQHIMITEESFIDFKCPYCGTQVSFPQENAGFAQACPDCYESLIVPDDGSPVGKSIPLPINTSRLTIRRFAPGDWKDLMELMSDEELFRYTDGRSLDEDEILRWIESDNHVKLTTPNQTFCLALEEREKTKLIGYIGLVITEPHRSQARLNIYLNRNFQCQGFGLEALQALLGFCFEGIKLHRVSASCDSRNAAACHLFEKLGLRREGEFLKDNLLHGEWVNTVWYAALAEERGAKSAEPQQS